MMVWGMWMMAAALVAGGVVIRSLWRRIDTLERGRTRVDRMGEAVTLLSETAEAGFAAVAQEIEKLQRAPVARSTASRATISRRVVKASTRGESIEQIARREAISEGEVRLHLALADTGATERKGTRRAGLRA